MVRNSSMFTSLLYRICIKIHKIDHFGKVKSCKKKSSVFSPDGVQRNGRRVSRPSAGMERGRDTGKKRCCRWQGSDSTHNDETITINGRQYKTNHGIHLKDKVTTLSVNTTSGLEFNVYHKLVYEIPYISS